jgi:hypothetical protein
MKQPFWTFPVILAAAALAIVLGLANLGLITIAGSGRAIVRTSRKTSARRRSRWHGALTTSTRAHSPTAPRS